MPPPPSPLCRVLSSTAHGVLSLAWIGAFTPTAHGVPGLAWIGAFTPTAPGVPGLTWIGALTSTSCDVSAVLRPDLAETRTKVARGRGTGPRRRFDVVALPT